MPAQWDTVSYTYDAAGNVTSIKDSAGNEVQYVYNAYSQLLEQKTINGVSDPVTTSYTYTNMGSVAETEGYRYAYDLNGNLTKRTTPTGAATRYISTQTYGITADTSTPGVIKLTASQSISRGEVYLCYLSFTAKADNIGKAYVFVYLCLNFTPLYQRYTGSTRPGHVLLRTAPAGAG